MGFHTYSSIRALSHSSVYHCYCCCYYYCHFFRLHCCTELALVTASRGLLFPAAVLASLWWLLLLQSMGSRVHRLWWCSMQAQKLWLLSFVALKRWNLPGPGIEPVPCFDKWILKPWTTREILPYSILLMKHNSLTW